MKKIVYSLITFALLGSVCAAQEQEASAGEQVETNRYYLGVGLSSMSLNNDLSDEEFSATAAMLQAGYRYNANLAIEGRYYLNISSANYSHGTTYNPDFSDYPTDFTNIGIYLKAGYPIENFNPYLLLGLGKVGLSNLPMGGLPGVKNDMYESGFQWGIGVEYVFNEKISAFADYVQMYNGNGFDNRATDADIRADAWTFGISYSF